MASSPIPSHRLCSSHLASPPSSIKSQSPLFQRQSASATSNLVSHPPLPNWPKSVPASPKQINYPLYAASLSPENQEPATLELLKQLMFVTDEAGCRDIELVKMVDFISSSSFSEEQAPTTASGSDSENIQYDTYEAFYRLKGRAPTLAIIVRLRMLQDTLLHLRLQQAKLTSTVLERQAAGSKTRLESAVKAWKESLSEGSSSSMNFPPNFSVTPAFASLVRISLEPTQHTSLPQITLPQYERYIKPEAPPVVWET